MLLTAWYLHICIVSELIGILLILLFFLVNRIQIADSTYLYKAVAWYFNKENYSICIISHSESRRNQMKFQGKLWFYSFIFMKLTLVTKNGEVLTRKLSPTWITAWKIHGRSPCWNTLCTVSFHKSTKNFLTRCIVCPKNYIKSMVPGWS